MIGHIYTFDEIRNYFLTGMKPTEEQFYRMLMECYNNDEEVIATLKTWTSSEIAQLQSWAQSEFDRIDAILAGLNTTMGVTFQSSFNVGGINIGDTINSTDQLRDVLYRILYKVFEGDVISDPVVEVTSTIPFGVYEAGTTINTTLSRTFTDGKLLTWNGLVSGETAANCSIVSYTPEYYIDNSLQTSNVVSIDLGVPTDLTIPNEVVVRAEQLHDASTTVAKNSDGTNSTAKILSLKAVSPNKTFSTAFKFFAGFIKKSDLSTLSTSSAVRNLTRFTGFLDPTGTNITAEDERYTSKTDGSEFYVVAAVPSGYVVKIDNESFMDTTLKSTGILVPVKLGGGLSSDVMSYEVFYVPCNGAAIRNLYTYYNE